MLFSLLLLPVAVYSHGRLTVPATRNPTGYENDPIGFGGRSLDHFVCRNDPNGSRTTVTAGQPLDMQWTNSAKHVGDCAVYVGYGDAIVNGVGTEKNSGQFVKIANVFDCKKYSDQTYTIDLPSWLPAGKAVIRWEWYALHVAPTIEFYAQCADVNIVSDSTLSAADLPSYSVIEPDWVLPKRGDLGGVGFRAAFDSNSPQFVTGPPCAFPGDASARNACDLTAKGTQGYIAVGEGPDHAPNGDHGPAPVPSPTQEPVASPVANPTNPPVANPTSPPVANPTSPPVEQPVAAPTNPPVESPVAAPTNPPVDGVCSNTLWAKCAGKNVDGSIFDGPLACCPANSYCSRQSEWYSQCIPGTCPNKAWEQCGGGYGFEGTACCPDNHYCQPMNDGSSQCVPNDKFLWFEGPENVLCKN